MSREILTPAEDTALRLEAMKRVKYYVDLANTKFNLHLTYPSVLFAIRGTNAGTANAGTNTIKFNPTLLRENPDEFIQDTVPHEVAHLVARLRHLGKAIDPHGAEWRNVMWAFGCQATRCHSFDVSNVPTRATSVPRRIVVPTEAGVRRFGNGVVRELD